ncbi:MAG: recombination protein RecR [Deltaproteobacteria bacterium]|nr:recombination protein RecR [Deltaproteobacteria bacterium]
MHHYPDAMIRLIKNLCRLPGIGEKSAERLAMHMLSAPGAEIHALARSIDELKKQVRVCATCFSLSDDTICRICGNPERNRALACVVEGPDDLAAIEKSGSFNGVYHVLQGLLSPMDGIGPADIRIRELIDRVGEKTIKEVIIATGTSVEGEATAGFLIKKLKLFPVRITRIASGIPMGGELKYADQVTLKKALDARHVL